MASIRRTLSPVPRPGAIMNGEACQVASPLSKSSSNSQNYPLQGNGILSSTMGSLDYALYKTHSFVLGLFSHRSSRPFERSKLKGQSWRKAFLHFLMFFIVGIFVGITPFVPLSMSANTVPKNQDFNFELYSGQKNAVVERLSLNENSTSDESFDRAVSNNSSEEASDLVFHKLLIIVTPTYARPVQKYYLNRLAHTLKVVPHPLLWIVVEMDSQSAETAEFLRNTGVMYRHLVSNRKNSTDITDRTLLLRNAALSHIETHRLDGIVYFADDDKIYSSDLFDEMRKISRIGTWAVAKMVESLGEIFFDGPICNGSQVIGWHVVDMTKRSRRFYADMLGFAFNSTIIWDQKRWHRPTLEPIRLVERVKEDFQASAFIEQLAEDESQMECFSMDSLGIMVWHHTMDSLSYPDNWYTGNNSGTIVQYESMISV